MGLTEQPGQVSHQPGAPGPVPLFQRAPLSEWHNKTLSDSANLKEEYILYAQLSESQRSTATGPRYGGLTTPVSLCQVTKAACVLCHTSAHRGHSYALSKQARAQKFQSHCFLFSFFPFSGAATPHSRGKEPDSAGGGLCAEACCGGERRTERLVPGHQPCSSSLPGHPCAPLTPAARLPGADCQAAPSKVILLSTFDVDDSLTWRPVMGM